MTNGYRRTFRVQNHYPHRVAVKIPANEPLLTERLTPREMEVLLLMAEGLENPAIAAELGIRHQTARVHVSNILDKLGAANRTQAVTIAFRTGLLFVTVDNGLLTVDQRERE